MKKREKVLVLGMGISGQSAAKYLIEKKIEVDCFDQNRAIFYEQAMVALSKTNGVKIVDDQELLDFDQYSFVVVSPGFSTQNYCYLKAVKNGLKIIGEAELGLKEIKNRAVAITGTNGKTTVTFLIEHVLNQSGIKAKALGNVGRPITSYLLEKPNLEDILIVELSSYQIETLTSQVFDTALILNITPDHLDRYVSFLDYAKTKIKLEHCLKKNSILFIQDKCYEEFNLYFHNPNIQLFGYNERSHLKADLENVYLNEKFAYKLPCRLCSNKSFEIENMLAAYAVCRQFNVREDQFLNAFLNFKKPSHRLEFVKAINDVNFYDDSKGTNIDAVIQAVSALTTPLYLIAGGVDKGASYEPWKTTFKGKVKAVFAIGKAAYKIKEELAPDFEVMIFDTLELAVRKAASQASAGESVLLSPGCSSFDMFKDYQERGNEFKKIVNLL